MGISIITSIFSRVLSVAIQYFFLFFLLHFYGASIAGEVSLIQAVASMFIMTTSMAMPKLLAVRFNFYSNGFFLSAFAVASFGSLLCAIIFGFVVPGVSVGWVVFVAVFFVKIIDALYELNSVLYRRYNLERKLLAAQFFRLALFLFVAVFLWLKVSLSYAMAIFAVAWFVGALPDYFFLRKHVKLYGYKQSAAVYKKLFGFAKYNALSALLATGLTSLPRYLSAGYLGAQAVGYFSLYFYIFVGLTTLSGLLIQLIVVKNKNFLENYKTLFWQYLKMFLPIISLAWLVLHFMVGSLLPLVVGADAIIVFFLVSSVFAGMREFWGFIFIRKGFFLGNNASNVISILIVFVLSPFAAGSYGLVGMAGLIMLSNFTSLSFMLLAGVIKSR